MIIVVVFVFVFVLRRPCRAMVVVVVGRRMLRLGMGSEAGAGTPMSIISGLRGGGGIGSEEEEGGEEEEEGTRIRSAAPREGGRGRSVSGWWGTVVGGFWSGGGTAF